MQLAAGILFIVKRRRVESAGSMAYKLGTELKKFILVMMM